MTSSVIAARLPAAPVLGYPVAASSAVLSALSRPCAGSVLGVVPYAVYVGLDDPEATVLTVSTCDGTRLPNALMLACPSTDRPFARHRWGQRAAITPAGLMVGCVTYRPVRWWTPRHLRGSWDVELLPRNAAALAERLDLVPPLSADVAVPAAELAAALADGDAGRLRQAGDRLLGLGGGSTPAGDDLLAGVLVVVAQLGRALPAERLRHLFGRLGEHLVAAGPGRTTALSASLLRHAAAGRAADPVVGVVEALAGRQALDPALDALLRLGSTSGADTARGLLLGARSLLATS